MLFCLKCNRTPGRKQGKPVYGFSHLRADWDQLRTPTLQSSTGLTSFTFTISNVRVMNVRFVGRLCYFSLCCMIQTQTVQRTTRLHSCTEKTAESTRKKWRQLYKPVGTTTTSCCKLLYRILVQNRVASRVIFSTFETTWKSLHHVMDSEREQLCGICRNSLACAAAWLLCTSRHCFVAFRRKNDYEKSWRCVERLVQWMSSVLRLLLTVVMLTWWRDAADQAGTADT